MENQHHWNNPEKIKELVNRLVAVPSISGTQGENSMSEAIIKILDQIPYFKNNSEHIIRCAVPNDSLSRSTVMALYKANSNSTKTIVLLSHFDVVGIDDFGYMKPYAFQPEKYTEKLRQELYETLDNEAKKDLDSGTWLFGRGIMDMKAGLAIQLAVLSELIMQGDFNGNILLVATPDEERNSQGMFAAIPALNELKHKYNLEYEVCICSEPNFASYPGDRAKYIYTGSVGKLLPLIFCAGKETHVGEPLEGLNAGWMVSEIVNKLELSDEFIDQTDNEKSPPPTLLKISDLKTEYNVQTPSSAYLLYNILTLEQSPSEVLNKLKAVAEEAGNNIFGKLQEKYKLYELEDFGEKLDKLYPKVYTYQELYEKGKQLYGKKFEESIHAILYDGKELDSHQLSVKLSLEMTKFFIKDVPFYLIMFAPPYYPHVFLNAEDQREQALQNIVVKVIEDAKNEFDETVQLKKYFPGLSDVSYCRIVDHVSTLIDNMPLLGNKYKLPIDDIISLNLPTINIGPYGKDAHKRTERLELEYSTNIAPNLLKKTIEYIFNERESHGS